MLLSGDEFANTQYGNNNAYCQDNAISWLDWDMLSKNEEHYDYVRRLIAFRKAHPVLANPHYEFEKNRTGYPEVSFHGTNPWDMNESEPALAFAYMYAEDHEKFGTKKDCFIYVAINAHWEEHSFGLPIVPKGYKWRLAFEASGFSSDIGKENKNIAQDSIALGPRSSAILLAYE